MVKKSDSDTGSVESAATQKSPKDSRKSDGVGGLFRSILFTLLGVTLALGVGLTAIHKYVIQKSESENSQRLASVYAHQYVGFFDQVFMQAVQQVAGVTSDPSLVDVILNGDPATVRQRGSSLAAMLSNHSQVFLIPSRDPSVQIPLGYAAQSMVDRSLQGEVVAPEIIPFKDHPLLLLAATVRGADKNVAGALLVGFELNEIAVGLKSLDSTAGAMSLVQSYDDSSEQLVVLTAGDKPVGKTLPPITLKTVFPSLSVSFVLKPELGESNTMGLFILLTAGTIALVLAAIVFTNLVLQNTLRRNASMLLQYAEALILRAPLPAGLTFTMEIFEEVAASLMRSARAQNSGEARNTPVPGSARHDTPGDHEIPDIDAPLPGEHMPAATLIPDEIFRAYDIRGVVGKTLTDDIVRMIGKAIGTEALENRQQAIHVGRDGRLSGPQLLNSLIEGITSTGCNVINVGMVPTPVVYFAAANSSIKSGVMLTGSHNPPDYNGLKIVIAGETLSDQRIQGLKQRILKNDLREGKGTVETIDTTIRYIERIKDDIVLARTMKIVIDCGNGVAGAIAPQLFQAIGCNVIPLFCDVDGNFPNHHPDPSKPENLQDLIAKVIEEKADIGLAFDGDGDRIGVVTPQGHMIYPDKLMMLYARDLLMRMPGADIIFDVKCTRDLAQVISQHGGRPLMWRTGHSLIKSKLKETGAALAGEMSGHIFFNDRWPGFDDGLYAACRLLEILSLEVAGADEVFAEFPSSISTPELNVTVTETNKFRIIERLQQHGEFPGGTISTIDGVRVDYPNGWGLVRASNTTPVLVARFEGRTDEDLSKIRDTFREQLQKADPALHITF